ncbi:hypothetical protein G9G39_22550 [Cronobacter sp. EKM101R]|uniref:hypothetical protein n=1 Tax=Cronobacter TaxID=413496 RepID=UPI0013EAB178|nr:MULTISPECIES: hypothetical protein [Cronobacter]KAF6589104.1 hypothetical protein G9G39_22550 [Cronobacter sp. EKM101R]KAF6592412.1 hypothetical protein G9G38_22585 [Cronobacter sp. EKM102R]MDK1185205.1 hypothetical protein [Cronobacter turicensis]MDK1205080.1 hypothetical protein [Cronobacter turicensis]MDK1216820.1 hypothetical protein [Cronobacter turicensis]
MNTAKLKASLEKASQSLSALEVHINQQQKLIESLEQKNADLRCALAAAEKRNAELTDALKQAVSGYKSCLRTGHECIVELGGECDAPEVMIAGNPDIRQAEKVLAAGINLETGGSKHG